MCVYLWIFPNFNVYLQAGGKAGKDSGKSKAKAVSRSARAGLQVNNIRIFLTNKKKIWKKMSLYVLLVLILAPCQRVRIYSVTEKNISLWNNLIS